MKQFSRTQIRLNKLKPDQKADLERTFRAEYLRRVKAGEAEPYAALMAERAQMTEFNRLIPPT